MAVLVGPSLGACSRVPLPRSRSLRLRRRVFVTIAPLDPGQPHLEPDPLRDDLAPAEAALRDHPLELLARIPPATPSRTGADSRKRADLDPRDWIQYRQSST